MNSVKSWSPILGQPSLLKVELLESHFLHQLANWNHPCLANPYWRLYWNPVAGSSIRYQGRMIDLTPDRMVFVLPMTECEGSSQNPVDHFFIHFRLHDPIAQVRPGVYALDITPHTRKLMRTLVLDCGPCNPYEQLQRNYRLAALVCNQLARVPLEKILLLDKDEGINRVLQYINSHIGQSITNAALAQLVAKSLRSFLAYFKQHTGTSPASYILLHRIKEAAILLKYSEKSIKEIAQVTGFCDGNHFSVMFKRCMGTNPSAYRKTRF
jgi:AraC-like DNA-binding protein